MNNILTHLDQYGHIPFAEKGFCDTDNLILSYLAYADMENIVPALGSHGDITVKAACDMYFSSSDASRPPQESLFSDAALLKAMAAGERYRDARLSNYTNQYDEATQKQFAAITVELDDGTVFVAFRGTDNSLVSWREDFNMSFETTPSELESVRYLEAALRQSSKPCRVGGHSKGGHLSLFACTRCADALKEGIIAIYNNDGPGLDKDMIGSREYARIRHKVTRIIPSHSIFGMLFEHDDRVRIVKSGKQGFKQHDCMSWIVEDMDFVEVEQLEEKAAFLGGVFDKWIDKVPLDQRRVFVETLFDTIAECGMETFSDFMGAGMPTILKTVVKMNPLGDGIRQTTAALIGSFIGTTASSARTALLMPAA